MTPLPPEQIAKLQSLRSGLRRVRIEDAAEPVICIYTGKRRFASWDEAEQFRLSPAIDRRRPAVPCRSYECPDCGGYHLTHQRRRR